jgi:hypothetical protein
MERKTIGIALGLALLAGSAWAVIDRGIQFSQDTSTSYITSDSAARHLHTPTSGAPAPVASSCGTAPTVAGNDFAGTITTGSAATTCTVTFAVAYPAAPRCFVVPQGNLNYPTYTTTTTTIAMTVDVASTAYFYLCLGQ